MHPSPYKLTNFHLTNFHLPIRHVLTYVDIRRRCAVVTIPIKSRASLASLAFFLTRKKQDKDQRSAMSSEAIVRSSVSEEAVLDLLMGAGLGRAEATTLITTQPEQSSPTAGIITPTAEPVASQSALPSTAFEQSVVVTLERMSQRLDDLSAKVAATANGASPSPVPSTSSTASTPETRRLWADIPIDEVQDYTLPLPWAQEEDAAEEPTRPLIQVSEHTAKTLKAAFSRPLPNQARLQTRKPYPLPNSEVTKCPKLDPVAKQLLQKEPKQADASLAKLQALVLDVVAPLVHIMEGSQQGTLNTEQAAEASKSALSLLGNASAQISRERRKRVILCLNKKLHPLAEEEDMFEESAPLLLGKVFETKM